MNRRTFLRSGATAAATAGTATLGGCLGLLETRSARSPPVLDDRPDGVYYPTHVEGMAMGTMATDGDYAAMTMYSYPHRFWNVNGDSVERTPISDGDDAHIMVSVFDPETTQVLPDVGVDIEISSDGETVSQETIYPMLSQPMGFHYGANFDLGGVDAATLTIDVAIGGVGASGVATTGEYDGRFEEQTTIPVELTYSDAEKQNISYEQTPEKAGRRKAREPMQMDGEMRTPRGRATPVADLPGRVLDGPSTGDAVFATTLLDAARFDGTYLAVSPRTPYNHYVIPRIGIDATVARDGDVVLETDLTRTLDHELGYHYGLDADLRDGDELTLSMPLPAQVARHEGYEMAFRDFEDVTITV